MMAERFHYSVYGLRVQAQLPLPELLAAAPDAPQVFVRRARVPLSEAEATGPWFFVRPDGSAMIRVDGVATYRVHGGSIIEVDVAPGADDAEVRLFLLGSAFGVLVHQRGDLPLHVSSVVVRGQVWAFTAPSGTGKSTLAAGLHLYAGLPLFSDDVAVWGGADSGGGHALHPGPAILKLTEEALHGAPPSRAIERMPEYRGAAKERVRIEGSFASGALPLAGIVLLERDPEATRPGMELQPLSGVERFKAAHEAVYRLSLARLMVPHADLFQRLGALAQTVPFYVGRVSPPGWPHPGAREVAIRERLMALTAGGATAAAPLGQVG